jgi:hypothetical protein
VTLGTWVAAILTLGILSFLYKDNPLYKLAEHIFVGVSAAYTMVVYFWTQIKPNLAGNLWPDRFGVASQEQNLWYLVPLLLGLFMLARLVPRIGWISRWSLAFVVGMAAGLRLYSFLQSNAMAQIRDTIQPVIPHGDVTAVMAVNNLVIAVGVFTGLVYFYFSKAHTGAFGVLSRVGIYFLMVSFGAAFGFTVMGRISLLIGRLNFLMFDWIGAMFRGG